jgi:hypothetical protein
MVQSAIAGAATPNVAYGGPTDIIRSLLVGQEYPEMLAGRREARALVRPKAEADIEYRRAAAEAYRGLAADRQRRVQPRPGRDVVVVGKGLLYDRARGEFIKPPDWAREKADTDDQDLMQEFLKRDTSEARRKVIERAMFMRYGHSPDQPRNPTEASLAYDAAKGDEIAQRALKILESRKGGASDIAVREKNRAVTSGWERYKDDLNQAEQDFARAKAELDKVKPFNVEYDERGAERQQRNRITMVEYKQRLHDLESTLQAKKNNADAAVRALLDQYDVPYGSSGYPHPSTQRTSAKPEKVPEKKPGEELPPEWAAKVPESGGKRGTRIFNPYTNKTEIWTRKDGQLIKVRNE